LKMWMRWSREIGLTPPWLRTKPSNVLPPILRVHVVQNTLNLSFFFSPGKRLYFSLFGCVYRVLFYFIIII
jgi:hypothetical protein